MNSQKMLKVGDRIPSHKWIPTELQLRQYAEASGDYNPIHLDDKYAEQVGLGGVIAHGMLIMAQMGIMLTDWLQENEQISKFELKFKKMVRPGDTILCVGQIKEKLGNTFLYELGAQNQEGIEVVSGTASITIKQEKSDF